MAISDTILKARQGGYSDDDIIKEIIRQSPEKGETFKSAFSRGAKASDIINEIMRQNKPSLAPRESLRQEVANRKVIINEIQGERKAGDISGLRSIFQQAGQIAGLATSLGMRGISAITPEVIETPVARAIGKVGEKIGQVPAVQKVFQKLEELKKTNPNAARDIESALNIAGLIPVGLGGKVATKGIAVGVKTAGGVALKTGKAVTGAGKNLASVVADVIPGKKRIINYQITRALDLTQGDVKNIASSTGHEVGEFLAEKNLIGTNKKATQELIDSFYKENHKLVREEIAKVKTQYGITDIPRYQEALTELRKQVTEVPGLQESIKEIDALLKKSNPSLKDVQRVKELMDDHFSLYKVTGDVKESIAKKGLANIRKELKEFIEKEVKQTTGTDIAELNTNVSTARSTLNAIEERSTRGLTRSNIKIGDLAVFGLGSFASPLVGAALVFIKKVIESPTIRLRLAKYLDKLSDARKAVINETLEAGQVPGELSALLK